MSELGGRPLRRRPVLITLGVLLLAATALNIVLVSAGFDDPEWLPTVLVGVTGGLLVIPLYRRVYDRFEAAR